MELPGFSAVTLAAILGIGVAAGFINAVAGGGSLLTLPALIFLGLPAAMANGTNRIGILLQNAVSSEAFRRERALRVKLSFRLTLAAAPGALLGAWLAVDVSDALFRRILAVIMVGVLLTILRPGQKEARREAAAALPHPRALYAGYFLAGIYSGFIQAGLGFILLAMLTNFGGLTLVESNAVKVFTMLFQQVLAIAVFSASHSVHWGWGLILAAGMMVGGWAGVRWQVAWGEIWIRRFLVVCILAFAVKLFLGK